MQEHEMHSEFFDVSIDLVDELINNSIIIPVGTTSLRTIESLYWIGVKIIANNGNLQWPFEGLTQWDAYELPQDTTKSEALSALKNWMIQHSSNRLITKTQLLVAPSYKLRIAGALVTNFHQPQSTLLLLVSAIVGKNWRTIYEYALDNDFRFLSYGDGSILFPAETTS
jgi:S-adenosylmethionine:tRNA ribosyltransferase-isomerase